MLFVTICAIEPVLMVEAVMRVHFIFIQIGSPLGDLFIISVAREALLFVRRRNFLGVFKVPMAGNAIKVQLAVGKIFGWMLFFKVSHFLSGNTCFRKNDIGLFTFFFRVNSFIYKPCSG